MPWPVMRRLAAAAEEHWQSFIVVVHTDEDDINKFALRHEHFFFLFFCLIFVFRIYVFHFKPELLF